MYIFLKTGAVDCSRKTENVNYKCLSNEGSGTALLLKHATDNFLPLSSLCPFLPFKLPSLRARTVLYVRGCAGQTEGPSPKKQSNGKAAMLRHGTAITWVCTGSSQGGSRKWLFYLALEGKQYREELSPAFRSC